MFERTALDTEHILLLMCISIISCEIATETLDLSRTHTTKAAADITIAEKVAAHAEQVLSRHLHVHYCTLVFNFLDRTDSSRCSARRI